MEFNKNEGYCEERYTESELAKGILILLKEFYIGDFETDEKLLSQCLKTARGLFCR